MWSALRGKFRGLKRVRGTGIEGLRIAEAFGARWAAVGTGGKTAAATFTARRGQADT